MKELKILLNNGTICFYGMLTIYEGVDEDGYNYKDLTILTTEEINSALEYFTALAKDIHNE